MDTTSALNTAVDYAATLPGDVSEKARACLGALVGALDMQIRAGNAEAIQLRDKIWNEVLQH